MAAKVHGAAKARRDLVIMPRPMPRRASIDGAVAARPSATSRRCRRDLPEALTNADMFRAFAKAMPGTKLWPT